jgi:hypothetical protein
MGPKRLESASEEMMAPGSSSRRVMLEALVRLSAVSIFFWSLFFLILVFMVLVFGFFFFFFFFMFRHYFFFRHCSLFFPSGVITDWEKLERIWHLAYHNLNISPEDHPVLLSEVPSPPANREKMATVVFESFGCPAMYAASASWMSLVATGRTTGLTLTSGHGLTEFAGFYEGVPCVYDHSWDMAGKDVTANLLKLLQARGCKFPTEADKNAVADIKKKLGYVAKDYDAEMKKAATAASSTFKMPDGQVITVGSERFRGPEILFDPGVADVKLWGITAKLHAALTKCDSALQEALYFHIVLSGGNTLLAGFAERLHKELVEDFSPDSLIFIHFYFFLFFLCLLFRFFYHSSAPRVQILVYVCMCVCVCVCVYVHIDR